MVAQWSLDLLSGVACLDAIWEDIQWQFGNQVIIWWRGGCTYLVVNVGGESGAARTGVQVMVGRRGRPISIGWADLREGGAYFRVDMTGFGWMTPEGWRQLALKCS